MFNKISKWKNGLFKSRQFILGNIERLITGKKLIDASVLNELEEILIRADIGIHLTEHIISSMKHTNFKEGENNLNTLKEIIEKKFLDVFEKKDYTIAWPFPLIILIVGVNGSGKTSTIGKLAYRFCKERKKVLVAAADTFRAAAVEQLEIWKNRAGVDIIKAEPDSDPSALVYDACKLFKERKYDVLLIDTAGRLHTKTNLMEELKKIKKTVEKLISDIHHETLLVMDATCGQNGIQQAKMFKDAVHINGVVLTKLDGTAKGGIALSIKENLNIPVKLIGLGEGLEDLEDFSARDFVSGLLKG